MKADLPPLYFIRHGETDWNKTGMIQGSQGTDINAKGIEQAGRLAAALAARRDELAGYDFYVSPQLRAKHTMDIIASAQPRAWDDITIDPRLRELEFGVWEGRAFWELKASPIYPADAEGLFTWQPDGGESYANGLARVAEFLSTLTAPSLIVSHGAVGRCLIGLVTGLAPEALVRLKTPQGCYCRLHNGTMDWVEA